MCVYEILVVYTLNPLRIVFGFREGMHALDPAVMKIDKMHLHLFEQFMDGVQTVLVDLSASQLCTEWNACL